MNIVVIKNQSQFDALPSKMEEETIIEIRGRLDKIDRKIKGVRIDVCGDSHVVEICGLAEIGDVYDSAKIGYVYGSAKIWGVYGSAKIVSVYGLAEIEYVYGSARINHLWDSAKIQYYYSIFPIITIRNNAQILQIGKPIPITILTQNSVAR